MKYSGMPMGMWLLFSGSFRKQLVEELGYSRQEATGVAMCPDRDRKCGYCMDFHAALRNMEEKIG